MDKNVSDARTALDHLVKVAGACEDRAELHKKAVDIFGKELGLREGLIKNACMAFNSNKAVYKLSKADDNTRGEDFALVNPEKVWEDIKKTASAVEMKKLASDKFKPVFVHTHKQPATFMHKAASAEEPINPAEYIEVDTSVRNMGITVYNTLKGGADIVQKIASAADRAKTYYSITVDNTNRVIAGMPKHAAAEAGGVATAKYGELLKDIQWGCKELRKYASDPKMPEGGVYDQIQDVAHKAFIADCRTNLVKTACASFAESAEKLAGAYNLQRLGMRKQADGILDRATGNALGAALPEVLGLQDGDRAKNYDKLMNANVSNILRELEMKRNFFEVYDDDYISTFPLTQVQIAYNAAIQKLPDKLKKHPSSATQLIRSWVTKQLSHGGVTSAEDAEDVMKAAESMRNERIDINPFRLG